VTAADFRPEATRFGTDAFYAAIGRAFVAICAFVPVLFLIEIIDVWSGDHLQRSFGVRPRSLDGLDGILFAHFLHVDYEHLVGNSVTLIPMGTFMLAAGARRFLLSTALIAVVAGLGVWLVEDNNVVGASGVIFGWFGVLLMRGLVERSWWNIAVGLLIGLVYGWMLLGILPTDGRVSWLGHLFGFIGGLIAAVVFRRRRDRGGTPRRERRDPKPRAVRDRLARLRRQATVDA
jgi:membrane associated rhomboid family serine protease